LKTNEHTQGRFYPSIHLVCCGNIRKETHKLLDPDKISVGNLLSVSQVDPANSKLEFTSLSFFETKRVIGLIGTEKSCPMLV